MSGVITTKRKIENFIENDDEWFSGIELKVLDLEKELTDWRESRTREFLARVLAAEKMS